MKRKIQMHKAAAGGLALFAAAVVAGCGAGIAEEAAEVLLPVANTVSINEKKEDENRKTDFSLFEVIDDGAVLPDNQKYTGIVCNIKESVSEVISVKLPEGISREQEVSTMNLNNIRFSVPDGGSRCFGVPIFSTEYYAEGEWEQKQEWHDVEGIDCPEFNEGMEEARRLIREGYLQKHLEKFLLRFPELHPAEREYVLRLTGGGRTDRESDDTSWWELDYVLYTKLPDGEDVPVVTLDITKIIRAQGWEPTDDARCRIWTAESGFWRLLEDASTDLGKIWVSQLQGEDFSDKEKVCAYVEKAGADFDILLPSGADRKVKWRCSEEKAGWYNYLIWTGSTDTYDITLAIPLMEPGAGGWYLASRIKKEAVNKEVCRDTLLTMMQTFHQESSYYTVRAGDTLWEIYRQYMKEDEYSFKEFAGYNAIKNPDLIYPGWVVRLPGR